MATTDIQILNDDRQAAKLPQPATYLSSEQEDYLKRPTPKALIKKRKIKGGAMANYVDVHAFEDAMDYVFGRLWSFHIDTKEIIDGFAIVSGHVTVHIPIGVNASGDAVWKDITKSQFGGVELKTYSEEHKKKGAWLDIGNDFKAAASDCFKKCCVEFGVFRDVYMKEEDALKRAARYEARKANDAKNARSDAHTAFGFEQPKK